MKDIYSAGIVFGCLADPRLRRVPNGKAFETRLWYISYHQ